MDEVVLPHVGGYGGTEYVFSCPANTYITSIDAKHGDYVNRLKFGCGRKDDKTESNTYGTRGDGVDVSDIADQGYIGASAYGGKVLTGLNLLKRPKAGGIPMSSAGIGKYKGPRISKTMCPDGMVLGSVKVRNSAVIDAVQFGCRPIPTNDEFPNVQKTIDAYIQESVDGSKQEGFDDPKQEEFNEDADLWVTVIASILILISVLLIVSLILTYYKDSSRDPAFRWYKWWQVTNWKRWMTK